MQRMPLEDLWGLLQVSVLAAGASALYGAAPLPKEQSIARWGLGINRQPSSVICYGGRLGYQAERNDPKYIDAHERVQFYIRKLVALKREFEEALPSHPRIVEAARKLEQQIPDEMTIVPTLQEAGDIVEMENIERELGF